MVPDQYVAKAIRELARDGSTRFVSVAPEHFLGRQGQTGVVR